MRIKLKQADDSKIVELDDQATVTNLLDMIMDPVEEVRFGFPPQKLNLAEHDALLSSLGVRSGEQLAIKLKQEANPPAAENITAPVAADSDDPQTVPCGEGQFLKLRVMEDDNSCMFNAVAYCIMRNTNIMFELRTIIADTIRNDPENYSDAILGKPRDEYIKWILKETSWGGAIELAILSKHFEITINCFDIKTLQQHKFNPGMATFIVVAYSGIHYDAVALSPLAQDTGVEDSSALDTTVFEGNEIGMQVINSLPLLGTKLQKSNYYTDTNNFTLRCNDCNASLVGEKDALEHAKKTGHANFGEH